MDKKELKKFDQGKVLKTFQKMDEQFKQIFKDFKKEKLPEEFKKVNQILVCGMGGSALGPDLIRNIFQNNLKIPILINNNYFLPKWVNQKTLIIISSFSGNTEEVISCFQQAKIKKLPIFIITSGGKLALMEAPKFVYQAKYNYAQNPRFAIGYSIAIFVSLLKKIKVLDFCGRRIKKDINYFFKGRRSASKISLKIKNKIPVIIASEHLLGNAHVWQNQLNETSKNFSSYFSIPEICHHQFEGLSAPKNLNKNIIYILVNSNLYYERNQKRYQIMKNILKKKKINFLEIKPLGKDVWQQGMFLLGLSSYVSFYLAYHNRIDPQPNPWVDYLKEEMKK